MKEFSSLNGYGVKDAPARKEIKKINNDILNNASAISNLYFNNVEEMKNTQKFVLNSIVKTLGYYIAGDDGEATYLITNVEPDTYFETLSNGLYAKLLFGDTTNVKQFGAYGDGITDDTVSIRKAMEQGSINVYFPDGNYLTSEVISIPLDVRHIYGNHIVSITNKTTNIFDVNSSNMIIERINFNGDTTVKTNNAIIGILKYSDINTCMFQGFENGINLTDSWGTDVKGCYFGYNKTGILYNSGCNDVTISDNEFYDSTEAIQIHSCMTCRFINNLVERCGGAFIYDKCINLIYSNNYHEAVTTGLYLTASTDNCTVEFENNSFYFDTTTNYGRMIMSVKAETPRSAFNVVNVKGNKMIVGDISSYKVPISYVSLTDANAYINTVFNIENNDIPTAKIYTDVVNIHSNTWANTRLLIKSDLPIAKNSNYNMLGIYTDKILGNQNTIASNSNMQFFKILGHIVLNAIQESGQLFIEFNEIIQPSFNSHGSATVIYNNGTTKECDVLVAYNGIRIDGIDTTLNVTRIILDTAYAVY